jgi:hypothetical protein
MQSTVTPASRLQSRAFVRLWVYLVLLVALFAGVGCGDGLQATVNDALKQDSRNDGIVVSIHRNGGNLVLDLREVSGEKSQADVFRVLLQTAHALNDQEYESVALAHKGKAKFQVEGAYFKRLGDEYDYQNPVYSMRTFPENVYLPDGSPAFGSWTGGVIGVLGKQMEDFATFNQQWYLDDLIQGR